MTHFVADPEPDNFWTPPQIQELRVTSFNARANINLFSLDGMEIRTRKPNPRFRVESNYDRPSKTNLKRYILLGLTTGDEIAAFDKTTKAQMTDWLKIVSVSADRVASERATGTLPRSKIRPNLIFDAYSADIYLKGGMTAWIERTELMLKTIARNPVGKIILDAVKADVTIIYDVENQDHADIDGKTKVIRITPADFVASPAPGLHYDEILLHELAHLVDGGFDMYQDLGLPLRWEKKDFFTITVTNVYASVNSRPMRADHIKFRPIPRGYTGAAGEAKFNSDYKYNIDRVRENVDADVYRKLIFVDSRGMWNPFS